MDIRINKSNIIHIHNKSGKNILVIATENKDWVMGDIGFSLLKSAVLTAVAGGSAGVQTVEKIGDLSRAIKTIKDLYGIFSKLQKIYKGLDAFSQKGMEKNINEVQKLFRECSIKLLPNETKVVNEKIMSPFEGIKPLMPSGFENNLESSLGQGWGTTLNQATLVPQVAYNVWKNLEPSKLLASLSDVGDITLLIATDDFSRITTFNTNSDHSWIVTENKIVRAKYGTTEQEDEDSGWQFFSNTLGQVLCPGESMLPYDSIDIQTVNYISNEEELGLHHQPNVKTNVSVHADDSTEAKSRIKVGSTDVDEKDSDITVGKIAQVAVNVTKVLANEIGSKAGELADGVVAATKTIGSSAYKLIYLPNGNLAVYRITGDKPTEVWSTNTDGHSAGVVEMQQDGNLVVKDGNGEIVWAIYKSVPKGHIAKGVFVGFDSVSGEFSYFRKNMNLKTFVIETKLNVFRKKK